MQKTHRIKAFSVLGDNLESFVRRFGSGEGGAAQMEFEQKIYEAKAKNGWFDVDNQLFAIKSWAQALKEENLEKWLSAYDITEKKSGKTIGIITAGNIPMVGFHDILTVVMSGNKAQIKLSSNDDVLIPFVLNYLADFAPEIKDQYEFVEKLSGFDAVIATGSDNTARYFEAYFKNVPHLIRKNRTSVAVLTGNESDKDLEGLAQDILQYYGLGCRNVTKIYVPENYDLDLIFKPLFAWKEVINHHKYANNYDYHKAIYLMKDTPLLENGFLLMKEDRALFSPISTVFYEFYSNVNEVKAALADLTEKIQCVVGSDQEFIPFGKAQHPELWDYADHVDTMEFLLQLN